MNSLAATGVQRNLAVPAAARSEATESLAGTEIGATPEIEQLRRRWWNFQSNGADDQLLAWLIGSSSKQRLATSDIGENAQRVEALPMCCVWGKTKHCGATKTRA